MKAGLYSHSSATVVLYGAGVRGIVVQTKAVVGTCLRDAELIQRAMGVAVGLVTAARVVVLYPQAGLRRWAQ